MVYKFYEKKSSGGGFTNEPNYQLANELHKPIIRKFQKEKFIHLLDSIWGVDHWSNIMRETTICCVQLICLVNMHGLLL